MRNQSQYQKAKQNLQTPRAANNHTPAVTKRAKKFNFPLNIEEINKGSQRTLLPSEKMHNTLRQRSPTAAGKKSPREIPIKSPRELSISSPRASPRATTKTLSSLGERQFFELVVLSDLLNLPPFMIN